MIRDILAVVDNGDASAPFVRAVAGIAERTGAHLAIAVLTPMPIFSTSLAPVGTLYLPEIALGTDDKAAMARVRAVIADQGVEAEIWGLHDDAAWLSADIRSSHPIADLILVGGQEAWDTQRLRRRILETLVLASGTPILLLPIDRTLPAVRHAVLGWKPSAPAIRATHDLIRLAEPGARIDVVTVGTFDPDTKEARSMIARHLTRHGFEVEVHWLDDGGDEADKIEAFALGRHADLLAIGGFAHSRLREILLGGVTRSFIETGFMPILLSH